MRGALSCSGESNNKRSREDDEDNSVSPPDGGAGKDSNNINAADSSDAKRVKMEHSPATTAQTLTTTDTPVTVSEPAAESVVSGAAQVQQDSTTAKEEVGIFSDIKLLIFCMRVFTFFYAFMNGLARLYKRFSCVRVL